MRRSATSPTLPWPTCAACRPEHCLPWCWAWTASSQPVCLVTLEGKGLNETHLKDLAQFQVRNQISNVQGASVPQPYGGTYRQIQIYVDPLKLEAHNLSLNDVVTAVNSSNLILPAGDVRIGSKDYNVYANSQFPDAKSMNEMPLKSYGNSSVLVADVGQAEDSGALQYNIVRIDGQRSVYVPIFKQGGDSNTITIVNGMKQAIKHLVDIPDTLKTAVVFDQSVFVKLAIRNLVKEASIGLVLTGLMILLFLGSPRATFAVLLSIPLSALVCLMITRVMGGSINTMLLGGLALAFSRLIDDSVVVLENIFRFMEMGMAPREAAEKGGMEVSLAVLAATSTTSIVFFPVAFLTGISKYIFTPLALGVVFSIFASYVFAMSVVPLFCATFVRIEHEEDAEHEEHGEKKKISFFQRIVAKFNQHFQRLLERYEALGKTRPGQARPHGHRDPGGSFPGDSLSSFPSSAAPTSRAPIQGNSSSTSGCPAARAWRSAIEYIAKVENIIRQVVQPKDLGMIVSNIGVYPDLSAIYTTNASMDTAFVQTSLKEDHSIGSYEYMSRVRQRLSRQMPELTTYFQAGGLVDSVINQGLPAPIDVQVELQQHAGSIRPGAEAVAKRSRPCPT